MRSRGCRVSSGGRRRVRCRASGSRGWRCRGGTARGSRTGVWLTGAARMDPVEDGHRLEMEIDCLVRWV